MNPCPLQMPASAPVPQAAMPPFSLPLPVGPCPCRTIPNRSPGISPPTAPSPHPLPMTSPSSARLSPPTRTFRALASARTPAHKSDPLFQRRALSGALPPPPGRPATCRPAPPVQTANVDPAPSTLSYLPSQSVPPWRGNSPFTSPGPSHCLAPRNQQGGDSSDLET